jgi:hypothetical protein
MMPGSPTPSSPSEKHHPSTAIPPATTRDISNVLHRPTFRKRWLSAFVVPFVVVLIWGSSHHTFLHNDVPSFVASVSSTTLDSEILPYRSPPPLKAHSFSWLPSHARWRHTNTFEKRSLDADKSPFLPPNDDGPEISMVPTKAAATHTPSTPSSTSNPLAPIPGIINAGAQETSPPIPEVAWPVPTPFPQPFDSSLSYNFSETSCLSFFTSTVANNTFRSCRPFSLLLPASSAFFQIEGNLTALTATMGGTCDTKMSANDCQTAMDWYESQLLSVCREDLDLRNPIVLQARTGVSMSHCSVLPPC